jgi:peroxiredoxin
VSRVKRVMLWLVAASVTAAAAYVVGAQIGNYVAEQRRTERLDKGVRSTRAILDMMGTVEIGGKIPDVTLEDIDGQRHQLSEIVTERSLVGFIQTDCEACLVELEQIASVCRDTLDARRFILISGANPLHLRKLRDNFRLGCYFLYDEDRSLGGALRISSFPLSMVIDDSLKILNIHAGALPPGVLEQIINDNR